MRITQDRIALNKGNPASKADPDGHQGPGDVHHLLEVANRFASNPGGFIKSLFSGAGKQWGANIRENTVEEVRNFGKWEEDRSHADPHFSNDVEREGGKAFTATGTAVSVALIFRRKG